MRFARAQGHGTLEAGGRSITLVVALDFGNRSQVVRQESVPWLEFGPEGDVAWQVDQYTQETIGTILADDFWEPISEDSRVAPVDDGLYHSRSYVLRQMSGGEGAS